MKWIPTKSFTPLKFLTRCCPVFFFQEQKMRAFLLVLAKGQWIILVFPSQVLFEGNKGWEKSRVKGKCRWYEKHTVEILLNKEITKGLGTKIYSLYQIIKETETIWYGSHVGLYNQFWCTQSRLYCHYKSIVLFQLHCLWGYGLGREGGS